MIYSYNTETGEYSATMPYETETGDGKTAVAPPEIPAGKAAVYNTESQTWSLVNDYRFSHKKVDSELNIYDIENLGDVEDGFCLVTNETAENIELTPYKYKIQDGNVVEKTNDEIATARQEIYCHQPFPTLCLFALRHLHRPMPIRHFLEYENNTTSLFPQATPPPRGLFTVGGQLPDVRTL